METLTGQQPSTDTGHSAASLKVHFRCSLDDISNDNDNLSLNDGAADCSYRSHSEATSWSVSESDLTGQGIDEDEDDVNLAPDGGWGWVIVAASFVIHLIADGITFSFGVIYAELLDYFKESKGYTAVIGSLFMATPLLSGPLASSLTDRFGCRAVTIAGSIVAAIGLFLTSLSNSVEALFFTFLIAGLGLSLCYVAAIAVVAFYFDKRLSLATGLAVCGSGIGTFIFAPITQYLINEYGWRGAMLILSGIFLNIVICGALMREVEGPGNLRGNAKGKMSRSTSEQASTGFRSRNCSESDTEHQRLSSDSPAVLMEIKAAADSTYLEFERDEDTRLCNSLINLPTFLRHGDKIPHEVLMTITNNPRLYGIVLANYPTLFDGYVLENENKEAERSIAMPENSPKKCKDPIDSKDTAAALLTSKEVIHPHGHHWHAAYLNGLKIKKRSLTYRGAMLNLPRYRLRASSCPDIYRNSITTIAREKEGACWDYLEELRDVFMFDFSYLSNPSFVMFAISNGLLYCCYHVPYIYLTDWAKTQGQPKEDESLDEFLYNVPSGGRQSDEPSFLLSIVGILNTLGVIIVGYLGDRSWANPTWIYSASMLLCGLATAVVPLLPGSPWLEIAAGLFGLSIAANYSLVSAILVELISLERFVNAYGLLLLFQGVANLIGPPLAGWISDLTGSYDLSFYIAGIFIILSGAILVLLPAFQHIKSRMSVNIRADSLETGMLAKVENQQGRSTFIRTKESVRLGPSDKTISSTPI
ncbi:Monocarboxylate transporter [Daphnia magna]|uniref:Monocarboxylate transporter n=2 Tax=Daphnia magna TaxID=35525 RepID=A0A162CFD9_9CRUS|nr:Monocarboxylate transporter [Daphnia magna]